MLQHIEENPDQYYTIPKLPLFTITSSSQKQHYISQPGSSTPPLQTPASVPFQWEEQPGKPRPCTDIILVSTIPPTRQQICLELPPRLAYKTTSPTTVLDGPVGGGGDIRGKSVFSSSFRFAKERRRVVNRQVSFDSTCSGGWSPNDDVLLLGGGDSKDEKVVKKGKDDKGSLVISPSSSTMETVGYFYEEKKGKKMRRNSSVSKVTRSHFWASIYEGFKQVVVPWRKKSKKESFIL